MGASWSSNLFLGTEMLEDLLVQICRRHVRTREACECLHRNKFNMHMCIARCRRETVKHAMECFARLVKILMGKTAIAEKKLEFGLDKLEVLGVRPCITRACVVASVHE